MPTDRSLTTESLNAEIIRFLQSDGRMAYEDIAQALGVSPGTIRNRVTKMREAGLLQITAVVDPIASDYSTDAMLGIKVAPGVVPADVAQTLGKHREVVYTLWVSGRFDLLIELVCDGDMDIAEFLEKHIFAAQEIAHVEVMTRIDMFKNQYLLKRHVD